jgi:hypothetical protein
MGVSALEAAMRAGRALPDRGETVVQPQGGPIGRKFVNSGAREIFYRPSQSKPSSCFVFLAGR